jgi:carbon storage regulator CsrA
MNMLVLTRRIGEEIVIDRNIRVMVVAVKGDKVQLGTSAPPSVTVDRSEVHERRREFAYECDWSQPAPVDPFFENLAADLTDVAYRVALRHGVCDQWLELQLDLWGALTEVIDKRSCLDQEIQIPYDPRLDVD